MLSSISCVKLAQRKTLIDDICHVNDSYHVTLVTLKDNYM